MRSTRGSWRRRVLRLLRVTRWARVASRTSIDRGSPRHASDPGRREVAHPSAVMTSPLCGASLDRHGAVFFPNLIPASRRAYSLSALSLGAKRGRRSFPFCKGFLCVLLGAQTSCSPQRREESQRISSRLRVFVVRFLLVAAGLLCVHLWFRSCFRVAAGLRIPQNPGKSFYRVSDRAESIAWEHQTEDTLVI